MTTEISLADLETEIEAAWEGRDALSPDTRGPARTAVTETLALLDAGKARVAEKVDGDWVVRQWLKTAVLLSFPWWDKVGNTFDGWGADQFAAAGFRAIPGAIVRKGSYVAKNAILMPSFINIGAYVGEGTMVDTWATVGSCAQIGKDVHLSGGVGIGGVLEPLQANPTIIEDGCFIGARSEVVEGVIVGEGAVLSMGVFLSASTKIVDRKTGEVHRGRVPPYSVVVPGALPDPHGVGPSLSCAVIVKTVDAQTRSKTSVNELLRD